MALFNNNNTSLRERFTNSLFGKKKSAVTTPNPSILNNLTSNQSAVNPATVTKSPTSQIGTQSPLTITPNANKAMQTYPGSTVSAESIVPSNISATGTKKVATTPPNTGSTYSSNTNAKTYIDNLMSGGQTGSATANVTSPTTSTQPSAKDQYISAYKKYIDSQTQNEDVKRAKETYNEYVANQAKSIAGKEGQGRGIPLDIVRGQQRLLLNQTQPEALRLQGDVDIAQSAYEQQVGAAKSGAELQENLLGLEQDIPAKAKEYEYAKGQGYTGSFNEYLNEDAMRGSSATGGLTPYQQFQATQSISKDNQARTENAREMARQATLIENSYNNILQGGDRSLNTQAIITSFNKILDPTSVVRESEYDRTAAGQSLIARLEGKVQNIAKGGAGVTPETLKEASDIAKQYLAGARASIQAQNTRAENMATQFGLNPDFVGSTYQDTGGDTGFSWDALNL